MPGADGVAPLVAVLRAAGCVNPEEEAAELWRAFPAGAEAGRAAATARRLAGEPLAWVCGTIEVGGRRLHVEPGAYVPRRWQTPAVARAAATRLPRGGTLVDLCTGVGTVAALVLGADPGARVVGTDVDPVAVRCARRNGVDAVEGDLFGPLPAELAGCVDVVTAVAPYVPTGSLGLLPRDSLAHEPARALDGGTDGLAVVRRIAEGAPGWLRPQGWVVLELGPDQVAAAAALLERAGWRADEPVLDPDGDACGVAARWDGDHPAAAGRPPG